MKGNIKLLAVLNSMKRFVVKLLEKISLSQGLHIIMSWLNNDSPDIFWVIMPTVDCRAQVQLDKKHQPLSYKFLHLKKNHFGSCFLEFGALIQQCLVMNFQQS